MMPACRGHSGSDWEPGLRLNVTGLGPAAAGGAASEPEHWPQHWHGGSPSPSHDSELRVGGRPRSGRADVARASGSARVPPGPTSGSPAAGPGPGAAVTARVTVTVLLGYGRCPRRGPGAAARHHDSVIQVPSHESRPGAQPGLGRGPRARCGRRRRGDRHSGWHGDSCGGRGPPAGPCPKPGFGRSGPRPVMVVPARVPAAV
jgi:hypothetical protein